MTPTNAEEERILRRYRRDCRRAPGLPQEPSDVVIEGDDITVENVNGVLARYRYRGDRIYRE